MNRKEKNTIQKFPPKYRPIGAWGYLGYSILFNIPLIGFICLIVFALSGSNVNRRSFARSYFAGWLVVAIILVVAFVILYFAMPGMFAQLKDYVMKFYEEIMSKITGGSGSNPEESIALLTAYLNI